MIEKLRIVGDTIMEGRDFWHTDIGWLNHKIGLLEKEIIQLEEEKEELRNELYGPATVILTKWFEGSSLERMAKEKK
jgi:hypothetical protein